MNPNKIIRLVAIAGLATSAACSSKDEAASEYPQPAASQGGEATPPEPEATAKPTDGQILGILGAIDTGEIEQGKIAVSKATDPRVREFANHMIDQHTDAKQTGADLAAQNQLTPATSPERSTLENASKVMVNTLNESTSAAFDSTYLKGQVQQHQEAADLLRTKLAPAAQNAALAKQLRATQTMVQGHLNEAQQILSSLATGSQLQPTQLAPPVQH
jgi:putative membrane protein